MRFRNADLGLGRFRPQLNKLIVFFIFAMSNLTGKYDHALLAEKPGIGRWALAGLLVLLAITSSLICVAVTSVTQKLMRGRTKGYWFSMAEVLFGLFLVALFFYAIAPVLSKISRVDFSPQFENPLLLLVRLFFTSMFFAWLFRYEDQILVRLKDAGNMLKKVEVNQMRLVKAEEEQRTQTSRFLHDRVQGELMVVSLKLANLEKSEGQTQVAEISEIRRRLENLRRFDIKAISNSLTPNIEDFGLEYCVNELIEQLSTEIDFKINVSETPIGDGLQLQLGIYRIIEQALVNCLTHGPVTQVAIDVTVHKDSICKVTIADDGPGQSQAEIVPGYGSVLIDSWVGILNGSKEILSSPGKGYTLTVTCPI